jgi:hypothetical protein
MLEQFQTDRYIDRHCDLKISENGGDINSSAANNANTTKSTVTTKG